MKHKVSAAGRIACKAVRLSTSIPILGKHLQDGTLRRKLQGREPEWNCPKHLEQIVITMPEFTMEFLHTKGEKEAAGVILQLHGGGYYSAMRNKYRNFAAMYHEVSGGLSVLTIDYRVAPQHPFPAALEDAYAAYEWLLEKGYRSGQIILAGDSAGGGLCLALVHYLKNHEKPLPKAILTMSAWTDLTKSGESYKENFNVDPLFGRRKDTLIYKEGYYQGENPDNYYISPLKGDFTGFPPMLMQVGEYEMLLDDSLSVAEKARKQGVDVTLHVYEGMFHVFQMGELWYKESRQAWVEAGRFIRKWNKRS